MKVIMLYTIRNISKAKNKQKCVDTCINIHQHATYVALLILVKQIYIHSIKIKNLINISGILNTKLDYAMFCSFRVTNGPP